MPTLISSLVIALASILMAAFLPLLIAVYYMLRLTLHRESINQKIIELKLETEYLRIYHPLEFEKTKLAADLEIHQRAEMLIKKQFRVNNSKLNYLMPFMFTLLTSLILDPPSLYELLGNFWLSALLGLCSASAAQPALQPLVAFLGGLVPVATIEIMMDLFKKTYGYDKEYAPQSA